MKHEKDTSKIIIIKRYTNQAEAFIDATLLRDNGIPCCVNGAEDETVLPFLQNQVVLTVSDADAPEAARIVPGSQPEL